MSDAGNSFNQEQKVVFFLSSCLGGTFNFKNVFNQMRNLYISHNKVFLKMIFLFLKSQI